MADGGSSTEMSARLPQKCRSETTYPYVRKCSPYFISALIIYCFPFFPIIVLNALRLNVKC